MKMKLYSIYDKTAKRCNAPFLAENDEVAKRSFNEAVKAVPWALDFELYSLGDFDVESGEIFTDDKRFVTGFVGGDINGN